MIAISTTTSPNSALREISAPHVGPMSWMLTSVTVMPACFARELMSASVSDGTRQALGTDRDRVPVHDLHLGVGPAAVGERWR